MSTVTTKNQSFMPNWKHEEKCFENQFIGGKTRTGKQLQFPRAKPISQRRYENWLSEVTNPTTGQFYLSQADNNGQRNEPRQIVTSIVRIRTRMGREYLYSYGYLVGFNSFGDMKKTPCDTPELWTKTNFGSHIGTVEGRVQTMSDGPIGSEIQYELMFNGENLKRLTDLRESDYIAFSVKDEMSNKKVQVLRQNDFESTVDLFLDNTFDYLIKADYLSYEEKEYNRKLAEQEGLIQAKSNRVKAHNANVAQGQQTQQIK